MDNPVLPTISDEEREEFWRQFDAAVAIHGVEDLRADSELWADALKDGLDPE